jgi:hypothetical protein
MSAWMPIAIVAAAQVGLRAIIVSGLIWRDWVHARSNCLQIKAAAEGGVLVYETRSSVNSLLIAPQATQGGGFPQAPAGRERVGEQAHGC